METELAITTPWDLTNPNPPARNADGTFAKGSSGHAGGSTSKGQLISSWFRKAIESVDINDPASKCKLQLMFENMVAIAINNDPKGRKEATWAFNAIMDRTYGQAPKDDTELEAIRQGGASFTIVVNPTVITQGDVPMVPVVNATPDFVLESDNAVEADYEDVDD